MVSAVDVHVRRLRKVESRAVHQLMSLTIPTDSSLSIDLSRRRRQSMRRPTEAPSANSRISASCLRARLMLHSFVRSFVHSFIHSSATSESSLLRQLRVSVTRNSMFFSYFFCREHTTCRRVLPRIGLSTRCSIAFAPTCVHSYSLSYPSNDEYLL